jgi:hypothetical protein
VADRGDADDVPQEVFYELVEAYRMTKPVAQVNLQARVALHTPLKHDSLTSNSP